MALLIPVIVTVITVMVGCSLGFLAAKYNLAYHIPAKCFLAVCCYAS